MEMLVVADFHACVTLHKFQVMGLKTCTLLSGDVEPDEGNYYCRRHDGINVRC